MPAREPRSVLVLSLGPFPNATRTRKAARSYADAGHEVKFLGLQRAGRSVRDVEAGTRDHNGVLAHHVAVRTPDFGGSVRSLARNALLSFVPAFFRMLSASLKAPADVVHVTGVHLLLLALVHRLRFRSHIVMDINERPASVAAKGSLFGVMSRFEPLLLRAAVPRASVITVVAPGHARLMREAYGSQSPLVVRNAPLASWRSEWAAPPESPPLHVVTVGSIFPGRALEMLICATGQVIRQGHRIRVSIWGGGRSDYLKSLQDLIEKEQLEAAVTLEGRVEPADASRTYATGHVGLALYEAVDPGNDSLSNKIIETVASGRPVLAGDLPENRAFVTELGVGWLAEVTEGGIAEALVRISQLPHRELEDLAGHCYRTADAGLTWEQEFGAVLDRVEALPTRRWGRRG